MDSPKRCSRCVLPESTPGIVLDSEDKIAVDALKKLMKLIHMDYSELEALNYTRFGG